MGVVVLTAEACKRAGDAKLSVHNIEIMEVQNSTTRILFPDILLFEHYFVRFVYAGIFRGCIFILSFIRLWLWHSEVRNAEFVNNSYSFRNWLRYILKTNNFCLNCSKTVSWLVFKWINQNGHSLLQHVLFNYSQPVWNRNSFVHYDSDKHLERGQMG